MNMKKPLHLKMLADAERKVGITPAERAAFKERERHKRIFVRLEKAWLRAHLASAARWRTFEAWAKKTGIKLGRAEAIAMRFHGHYERLAPEFGYKTREATAKEWDKVPEQNRRLMIAVCDALLKEAVGT